jgi:prophage antirepressor-like protein
MQSSNDNEILSLFDFNGHQVRVVKIDGEPWFSGTDVLHILYGKAQGISYVYDAVSECEKAKVKRTHLGMKPGRDTVILSESGLHKLVLRSDKSEAKPFQDWVTKVVLPAIRKDDSEGGGDADRGRHYPTLKNVRLPFSSPIATSSSPFGT